MSAPTKVRLLSSDNVEIPVGELAAAVSIECIYESHDVNGANQYPRHCQTRKLPVVPS